MGKVHELLLESPLACSRHSDSRVREKNSPPLPPPKKKRGETRGGKGRETSIPERPFVNNVYSRSLALPPPRLPPHPPPPIRFPGVQFNSLSTDRRALLSERLEQAKSPLEFELMQWNFISLFSVGSKDTRDDGRVGDW